MLSVTFKDKKPLVKRLWNCLLQILHQLPSFIFQTAQLRFQEGKGIFQWWSWHGKSAWEIVEAIYHLWEIVARIYHPSPGWQKLRTRSPRGGGKVRVPNIRYLVANWRFVTIYAPLWKAFCFRRDLDKSPVIRRKVSCFRQDLNERLHAFVKKCFVAKSNIFYKYYIYNNIKLSTKITNILLHLQ